MIDYNKLKEDFAELEGVDVCSIQDLYANWNLIKNALIKYNIDGVDFMPLDEFILKVERNNNYIELELAQDIIEVIVRRCRITNA